MHELNGSRSNDLLSALKQSKRKIMLQFKLNVVELKENKMHQFCIVYIYKTVIHSYYAKKVQW